MWTLPAAPPTLRTCLLGRGHQPDCPPQPPAGLRSGPSKRGRKRPSVPIHATAFPSIMGARTAVCWNGRSTTLCVSMSAVAATDAQPCVRTVSRCRMQSVVTKHQVSLASCGAVATYSCVSGRYGPHRQLVARSIAPLMPLCPCALALRPTNSVRPRPRDCNNRGKETTESRRCRGCPWAQEP